ncbi:MAG: ATP-dependent Clp protease ATP-binding subunit ClpX, partial [Selenomonadaceae bacterium]|nr:ATP-dependent Clp protease ATP-binding subunit ClpX [Selenomonadaceae bacterium]
MAGESFHCSLCGRRVKIQSRSDMPVLDPNTGFGICKSCIKNIYHFIEEDEGRSSRASKKSFKYALSELLAKNKPHVIKAYLDEFIIMQERAKKILSVAAYNHYKRMKYDLDNHNGEDEIDKSNVIIMGPTGCGKTAMLSHLSRLLDIPFA